MEGEEMIKYRFTKKEVDEMSFNIRTHTDNEKSEAKSAWRLRLLLEGLAYCCEYNKKEKAKRVRRLALYERLTKNDLLIIQTTI